MPLIRVFVKKCIKFIHKPISINILRRHGMSHIQRRLMSSMDNKSLNGTKVMTPSQALKKANLKNGDTILAGGFGICGIPQTIIEEISKSDVNNLTVISNDCGNNDWGLGILLKANKMKRMIGSYMAENTILGDMYVKGKLELELIPQGTLAEKLRSGGMGIPAFYTLAGKDTLIQNGGHIIKYDPNGKPLIVSKPKEVRTFNGIQYIMEETITGNLGLVKAYKADKFGNLMFKKTTLNFNKAVAQASSYTIAEVDEIVEVGELKPEEIHCSGVYVQSVVESTAPKKIHKLVYSQQNGNDKTAPKSGRALLRERIAKRAANEFYDGIVVNLGIGMPTMIPDYVDPLLQYWVHSENGVLGIGRYPYKGEEDPDCINAGKEAVTLVDGASIFDSSEAFGIIRGNHLNCKFLGAMEISKYGDLANWVVPGDSRGVKGMGGGMDLVSQIKTYCIVLSFLTTSDGKPKIVNKCKLPITAKNCVNKIITDKAVFDVDKQNGLILTEISNDTDIEFIRNHVECDFDVSSNLITMKHI